MNLTKLKKSNLLKVGTAAILSVGVLSACGDDDPVIDENDDVEVDQPADVTPDDDVNVDEPEVDMEPDTDTEVDTEPDTDTEVKNNDE
ncbi:hypothetical protein CSV63_10655 [Sporosarcina sp. P34]|uniref:hypothetical protein n=1 Tax=Sporosarcina sp. P34 TaxID=2048247 RepID=UPI000C173A1F|nr:hypothetical protein [Sporosarcina sp. P34]PID14897.1 hypothetical protein CSV63_10655 [Sporosarcina sp. P34]